MHAYGEGTRVVSPGCDASASLRIVLRVASHAVVEMPFPSQWRTCCSDARCVHVPSQLRREAAEGGNILAVLEHLKGLQVRYELHRHRERHGSQARWYRWRFKAIHPDSHFKVRWDLGFAFVLVFVCFKARAPARLKCALESSVADTTARPLGWQWMRASRGGVRAYDERMAAAHSTASSPPASTSAQQLVTCLRFPASAASPLGRRAVIAWLRCGARVFTARVARAHTRGVAFDRCLAMYAACLALSAVARVAYLLELDRSR